MPCDSGPVACWGLVGYWSRGSQVSAVDDVIVISRVESERPRWRLSPLDVAGGSGDPGSRGGDWVGCVTRSVFTRAWDCRSASACHLFGCSE